jgi:hypothetical protein
VGCALFDPLASEFRELFVAQLRVNGLVVQGGNRIAIFLSGSQQLVLLVLSPPFR